MPIIYIGDGKTGNVDKKGAGGDQLTIATEKYKDSGNAS
jgi:hypothetical protein